MKTVILFYIPRTEKNCLWYKSLAGRTINEVQFNEVLANFWLDFTRIERQVRDVTGEN